MKWLFCLLLIWHSERFHYYNNEDYNLLINSGEKLTSDCQESAITQAINYANRHKAVSIQIIANDTSDDLSRDCVLIWSEEKK
jgi:hypothetical protein